MASRSATLAVRPQGGDEMVLLDDMVLLDEIHGLFEIEQQIGGQLVVGVPVQWADVAFSQARDITRRVRMVSGRRKLPPRSS